MQHGILSIFSRGPMSAHEEQMIRGTLFLGLIANYLLWGVLIVQSFYYYKSYRKTDSTWLKGAVGLLFVAEAAQSICASLYCWDRLVLGLSVNTHRGAGFAVSFIDAFTASIVHSLYAQKIWTLLNPPYNNICTVFVLTLSCVQLTAGLGCTIFMSTISLTFSQFARIKTWGTIWLVTAAGTDIIIAAVMTWKLSKSRTGVKETNDIISKLIRRVIEVGLATAIVQIVDIVLYLVWPLKPYHIAFAHLGPKVYSNSMLALLNSRTSLNNVCDMCCYNQDKPISGISYVRPIRSLNATTGYELDTQSSSVQKSGAQLAA